MKDEEKAKEELIRELGEMRQRTAELEKSETKRKRTRVELRANEEYYHRLVELSPETIAIHSQGKIIYVNPAGAKLLGVTSPEELIGKSIMDFVHPDYRKIIKERVQRSLEQGKRASLIEEKLIRPNGQVVYVETTATPVTYQGKPAILAMSRDITERKKTEVTLLQSEKLKALGEMAAGVAHDFNNLLAIISGNAQLLGKGLKRYKVEEIKERLRIIARTASEGGETVRRLQHFTQREVSTQDFTRIDLNKIVRSAVRSTSPRWKDEAEAKGITIRIKEDLGKLPPLLGNRSGLMQVLTNLIFNALEAIPEGGEITVRTEAKEGKVYLYFTDRGQGIPESIKDKIFDPFFTTKGPKASGFGLSICYGIIKRHKGKINVESAKGKGTTFTISIPVGPVAPLKKEKLKEPEKISSRKILVIDDEEGIREVLGRIFHDEGHRVTLAETARKGLEEFKKSDFDLVLTDLGMPEMSGWQLAKRIKEIGPSVPVGLITGWAVATPKEKMKEEGVDFILLKPFNLTEVVREVHTALKFKKR